MHVGRWVVKIALYSIMALIFLQVSMCAPTPTEHDKYIASYDKAVEAAHSEVLRMGYYEYTKPQADACLMDTPWNACVPLSIGCVYYAHIWEKLVNKRYWTVHFGKQGVAGGGACIFVDYDTGIVLARLRTR
jgi:hypothetical protein